MGCENESSLVVVHNPQNPDNGDCKHVKLHRLNANSSQNEDEKVSLPSLSPRPSKYFNQYEHAKNMVNMKTQEGIPKCNVAEKTQIKMVLTEVSNSVDMAHETSEEENSKVNMLVQSQYS